jgi:hypothetical protein
MAADHNNELTNASAGQFADEAVLVWPSHFPASECPPAPAVTTQDVHVLRVLKGVHASAEDFRSWMEEGHPNPDQPCQSCGLSVFLTSEHLAQMAKRIPSLRGKHFVGILLTHSDGLILRTPSRNSSQHHTWWKATSSVSPESRCVHQGTLAG